jgi:hypothetical protein
LILVDLWIYRKWWNGSSAYEVFLWRLSVKPILKYGTGWWSLKFVINAMIFMSNIYQPCCQVTMMVGDEEVGVCWWR